jgi:hypothetical protein
MNNCTLKMRIFKLKPLIKVAGSLKYSLWCTMHTAAFVSVVPELIMLVKVIQCSREFSIFLNMWENSTFFHNKCFSPHQFISILMEFYILILFNIQ